MTATTAATTAGFPHQVVEYVYDWQGRQSQAYHAFGNVALRHTDSGGPLGYVATQRGAIIIAGGAGVGGGVIDEIADNVATVRCQQVVCPDK